jgi:hypothetical protein
MVYKHKYFNLDTESRKTFDENGKELRLTGNSFRLLVFLCEKKNGTLTEIGEHLDWANDYTENHLRQYRYKINSIIGYDVVEYKNGIYSLTGELEQAKNLAINQRNTGLLQGEGLRSTKNIMNQIKDIKFSIFPAIGAIILLLLTFLDFPYGYYVFLRWIITGVAIYYAYYIYSVKSEMDIWFWTLAVIGIVFNPIVPIYLKDKSIWGIIDIGVALFLFFLIIKNNKK